MTCRSCALELPVEARFCLRCGAAVPGGPAPAEERRVVTVVFCDLVGSTELAGMLDPELLRTVLLRYYELMRECVERHGGVVEKFIGDAVMAVFGLVSTREDDALRAAAAALDMAQAPARLGEVLPGRRIRLAVRIGVHTGEVVTTADPGTRQALVSGEVVNVAARLQTAAGAGEVLLSREARRAAGPAAEVAPLGPLRLKGVAEPVEAVRLLALRDPDPHASRRFDVPFVGRAHELDTIALAWRRVAEQGEPHVLTLLGEAGAGKSRLLAQWLGGLEEPGPPGGRAGRGDEAWPVGAGRCRPQGTAGTLGPLGECLAPLVRALDVAAHGAPPVAALGVLRGGLLLDGTPSPSLEETYAAVVHVLAALADARPVLLVVDDCQWADSALLGVLERLPGDLGGLPVLLVCAARPELLESRAGWAAGQLNATTLLLGGLSRTESELLVASLAELVPHDGAMVAEVVGRAGGNPLYLEQLAAALGDGDGDGWDACVPPDLHALLAARIDRLAEPDRLALRHAAVFEGEFGAEDLDGLATDAATGQECAQALRSLARRRFLEEARRPYGSAPGYTFTNSVVQRVAYDGLTKRRRAQLHERYADRLAAARAPDAPVGLHLARAYGYRAEVGPAEGTELLRVRAADRLSAAGSLALRRMDLSRALELLDRAAELFQPADPGHPQCLRLLGEAQLTVGRLDEAAETLRRTLVAAEDRNLAGTAMHARLQLAIGQRDQRALDAIAGAALDVFAADGDELGLARARLVLAGSLQRRGRHAAALAELDHALVHSRAAAADRELANTLGAVGLALWHGPQPASAAAERCERLLAEFGPGRPAVQATLGFPLTVLYAIQGRAAAAQECRLRAREAMGALAYAEAKVFAPLLDALVLGAVGRARSAEPPLLDALEAARALRADGLILAASLGLARARLAQGDLAGAARAIEGRRAGPDRPVDRADLLGISALIAAGRGDAARADRHGAAALAASRSTDSPAARALALLDRARAQTRLGRTAAAEPAARAALNHYSVKEHAVGAAQARGLLEELALL